MTIAPLKWLAKWIDERTLHLKQVRERAYILAVAATLMRKGDRVEWIKTLAAWEANTVVPWTAYDTHDVLNLVDSKRFGVMLDRIERDMQVKA